MRNPKKNILMISQHFFPTPIGSSVYMTDLARWLAEKGFEVRIITERPYYPEYRIRDDYQQGQRDHETVFGVQVRRLPTFVPRGEGVASRFLNEFFFMIQVCALITFGRVKRSNRVVSLCPSILAVLIGIAAAGKHGHHVAVVHDIQSGLAQSLGITGSRWKVFFLRWIETFTLNRVDSVIVLCKRMEAILREQGVRKSIHVLPIWVDVRKIYPLTPRADGPPTLLYSGNLGRKQGLEQVIDVAKVLLKKGCNATVIIRGAGASIDKLRKSIQERCLRNVELRPLVPERQLNEALAEGHIHLVPQVPEGADYAVPSKIYAIMAAGRPFVCTAMPGSPLWSLAEETQACVCVPPHDPEAFASALIRLIEDRERCRTMGLYGRRYVQAHAERSLVLSSYAELIAAETTNNLRSQKRSTVPE